ncbi:MAG: peptide-methionine (S)-S-oxide reductase [Acidimicrobiaceae bacterium]|nr:peptide-methionine (S)-S-oxide reductase [Acidimicrobiaceae bacterium]
MAFGHRLLTVPDPADALSGRDQAVVVPEAHYVNGRSMVPPFPDGVDTVVLGMGCFWGAERKFWETPGVWTTAVGYTGGYTPNATYQEVCSGMTGHNEVVLVAYDTGVLSQADVLRVFWENHDPTQGMRQGNDVGTQYRSGIYVADDSQRDVAQSTRETYAAQLTAAGFGEITTEILVRSEFFYAEDYHQQYLAKNPSGYCGMGGTGVSCPVGVPT